MAKNNTSKLIGAVIALIIAIVAVASPTLQDGIQPTPNTDPVTPGTDPVPDEGNYTYLKDFPVYDATVTPFTFPESRGIPVYEAIENAKKSIDISIYNISSRNVLALLNDRVNDGIQVRILVDGTPLNIDTSEEFSYFLLMDNNGADVRAINYTGVPTKECRFVYNHSKYMIVDGDTVVVTSENWTAGNMSASTGNRGWGVVVESKEYAKYMTDIFESDFDTSHGDVKEIEYLWDKPCTDPATYTKVKGNSNIPATTYTTSYTAKVSPVVSPTTSYAGMKAFINSAEERLYIEELNFNSPYNDLSKDSPATWLADLAKKKVDVKVVLDISQSEKNQETVDMFNEKTLVKAAAIKKGSGFGTTHNKGIIADDMSWVGSINMTQNSVEKNREVAVMIYSQAVSDYYAGYFNTDFNNNYVSA